MKTIEELTKENEELKSDIRNLKIEVEDLEDNISELENEEVRLNCVLDEYEKRLYLDDSNLMEQQKAELLVKAQKKFTLQELEEMFGGNSFSL